MRITKGQLRRIIRGAILEGWAEAEDPQIKAAKARRDQNLAQVFGRTSPTAISSAINQTTKSNPDFIESNWRKEFEKYKSVYEQMRDGKDLISGLIEKYGKKELKEKIFKVYEDSKKELSRDEMYEIHRVLANLIYEINYR
jgi:hypothetical protein